LSIKHAVLEAKEEVRRCRRLLQLRMYSKDASGAELAPAQVATSVVQHGLPDDRLIPLVRASLGDRRRLFSLCWYHRAHVAKEREPILECVSTHSLRRALLVVYE
jgi:hypothetical protein